MDDIPDLVPHLEALRDDLGLTNAQLAEMFGIDAGAWSRIRRRVIDMPNGMVLRVLMRRPELRPLVFSPPLTDESAA